MEHGGGELYKEGKKINSQHLPSAKQKPGRVGSEEGEHKGSGEGPEGLVYKIV